MIAPRRPIVSLGDVLRAYVELDLSPEQRAEVLPLLGFAAPEGGAPAVGALEAPPTEPTRPASEVEDGAPEPAIAPSRRRPRGERLELEDREPTRLRPLERQASALPAGIGTLADVVPPAGAAPAFAPLFGPMLASALVTELFKAQADGGAIDVIAVVRTLAEGAPLNRIPRRPIRTSARGAQLLVDAGDGMAPFREDQAELVRAARRLVGKASVQVLRFDGTPLRGVGPGTRRRRDPWRPPPEGTPVIVVSDLGTAMTYTSSAALPSEWRAFAEAAHGAGCPTVALTPCRAERIPATLRAVMAVVEWDRTTGIADVRRAGETTRR